MSILTRLDAPTSPLYEAGVKQAADPSIVNTLYGMLQMSNGRLVVSVPNDYVRGLFKMLGEHGAELPLINGQLFACVDVMTADEVIAIGGPDKITERGKQYSYSLGRMYEVEPDWTDISKLWFVRVHSSDLQQLRRSYGLSSLPSDADLRICVAVRRRGVLGRNDTAKSN